MGSGPACGADFDVQERLGEPDEPTKTRAEEQIAPNRAEEAVSFQCPACGADFETQEQLAQGGRGERLTVGAGRVGEGG